MRYNKQWLIMLLIFSPMLVFGYVKSLPPSNRQPVEPRVSIKKRPISNVTPRANPDIKDKNGNGIYLDEGKLTWQTIMSENFEGSFPGTIWELLGSPTWDDESYNPHNGSRCGWCAGSSYTPPSSLYQPNMNAWMVYGPFDLSMADDAELNFYYWLDSEQDYDKLEWRASIDDYNYYGHSVSGRARYYQSYSFDLTNVPTLGNLCGQSNVWIAFIFTSDATIQDTGAFLDDIILRINIPPESGTSNQNHWASWWWPMNDNTNPNLYDISGDFQPCKDYDIYYHQGTLARDWEYGWYPNGHRHSSNWYGHCHAWAVISYMETTEPWVNRPPFNIGEQKGLLTECYYGAGALEIPPDRYWPEGGGTNMTPVDFIEALRDQLRDNNKCIVMDFNLGEVKNNKPVSWYQIEYIPTGGGFYNCSATITYDDYFTVPNNIGHNHINKPYTFTVQMSGGNPVQGTGTWTGSSQNDHPDFAWYTELRKPNAQYPYNPNPNIDYSNVIYIIQHGTAIDEDSMRLVFSEPEGIFFTITPNPCFRKARINLMLYKNLNERISLKIYDITGKCVKDLLDMKQAQRQYEIYWDGRDNRGEELGVGIYFVKLESEVFSDVIRVLFLK